MELIHADSAGAARDSQQRSCQSSGQRSVACLPASCRERTRTCKEGAQLLS